MKNNKKVVEFEEFQIDNLQNVLGGEIINFNTGVSTSYPQGDNIDITYDDYGRDRMDGIGGGTCGGLASGNPPSGGGGTSGGAGGVGTGF